MVGWHITLFHGICVVKKTRVYASWGLIQFPADRLDEALPPPYPLLPPNKSSIECKRNEGGHKWRNISEKRLFIDNITTVDDGKIVYIARHITHPALPSHSRLDRASVDNFNPLAWADSEGAAGARVGVTRRPIQARLLDLVRKVGHVRA